jgi:hypothetical protein
MNGLGVDRVRRMQAKYGLGQHVGLLAFNIKADSLDEDNGNRDVTFVATTDDIDLDGEVVLPSGGDWSHYERNRANFVDHKYDVSHHVGTLRHIRPYPSQKSPRGWVNRSTLFKGLRNPLADDLLTMIRQGGIGVSIGFESVDGSPPRATDPEPYQKARFIHRRWRGIEVSYTAMPCNVSARTVDQVSVDDSKLAMLDELVTKNRITLASAVAFGMPHRKVVAVTTPRKLRPLVVVLD